MAKKRMNNFYVTTGAIPGFFGISNLNYERNLAHKEDQFFTSHWIKFNGGSFIDWLVQDSYAFLGITSMTGKKNNHIELNYGFGLLGSGSPTYFGPSGSIGYRRQNPAGRFIFRTGIGYPEAVYLSLGLTL